MTMTADARAASLSFRQLRLFEAIGDLKSVRRASEECSLSQPAVTQALAKMEAQLGAILVDRRASGSYLNDLGEIFHARVKRFFQQAEQAVVDAGSAVSPFAARTIFNRLSRSQIRALIAVIECGDFDRAAATLSLSAASLQRAARDLEGNLRASLFYRTAAGMLVSPLGTRLGQKLKLALQEIELAVEELDAASGQSGRQLVIGAMPFGGSVLLAAVLDTFLALHPRADIRIINDSAAEMTDSLRVGDVDFVIGLLPETTSPELASEALAQTPYSVVARRGHPLLRKGRITVEDLVAYDWAVGIAGSSRRAAFERLFADRPQPPAQIATCATPIVRQLLERSDRLTLMTSYELQYADDRLRAVPFSEILPVPSLGIITRADWLPTRLHTDFMDIIRAHITTPRSGELRQAG